MRISELAKAAGITVETLRYYERCGLLPAPQRRPNGYRDYSREHLERLVFIRHCRALDIPLADIQRLQAFLAHPEADCHDIDQLIESRLAEVRQRLDSLKALEQQLIHLRRCCQDHQQVQDCGIVQKLLDQERDPPAPERAQNG